MFERPICTPAGALLFLSVAVLASCSDQYDTPNTGSCGSTGAVEGCTLIVSGGANGAASCEALAVATSSGGLQITIAAGDAGVSYPIFDADIVLSGLPEAGRTYDTLSFASASVVARTSPTAQWSARFGNGDDFGAVQLEVNEYSGTVIHGNMTALLVGETTGGMLSTCVVF